MPSLTNFFKIYIYIYMFSLEWLLQHAIRKVVKGTKRERKEKKKKVLMSFSSLLLLTCLKGSGAGGLGGGGQGWHFLLLGANGMR